MCLNDVPTGLLDAHVTWLDVQTEMQKCLGTDASFGKKKSVERIGEGSGFVSKMALVNPDWQNGTDELPQKLLIVSPLTGTSGVAVPESVSEIYRSIHNIEVSAYEILKKYGQNKIKIPKIFCSIPFSSDNLTLGFIIMEYLEDLDFRHFNDDLSYEQVKQVIPSLVTIQYITRQLSKHELETFPVNIFHGIYRHFFTKERMSCHIDDVCTMEDGYFSDLKEELDLLSEEILKPEYLKELDNLSQSMGISPVFQHCDVWAANLLWRKDDSLAAIIDFQILTRSSCAMDILKLILHMNGDERRLQYKDILREFYEAAKTEFGEKMPYTFEQLLISFEKLTPMVSMVLTWGTRTYLKMAREHRGEKAVAPLLSKIRMMFEDAVHLNKNRV